MGRFWEESVTGMEVQNRWISALFVGRPPAPSAFDRSLASRTLPGAEAEIFPGFALEDQECSRLEQSIPDAREEEVHGALPRLERCLRIPEAGVDGIEDLVSACPQCGRIGLGDRRERLQAIGASHLGKQEGGPKLGLGVGVLELFSQIVQAAFVPDLVELARQIRSRAGRKETAKKLHAFLDLQGTKDSQHGPPLLRACVAGVIEQTVLQEPAPKGLGLGNPAWRRVFAVKQEQERAIILRAPSQYGA